MRMLRAVPLCVLLAAMCAAQAPSPASKAWSAMVTIRGVSETGQAVSGSGFLVSANGTIVTNLHLVRGLSGAKVELANGDVFDTLTLVSSDARRDLAVVRIAGFDLPYIELGNSNQVQPGDAVLLVAGARQPISTGTVRGMVAGDGFRLIQTSAAADASAAGGLLINANGEAIGVLGYRNGGESAVAVPINYARGLLESAGESQAVAPAAAAQQRAPVPKSAPAVTRKSEPQPAANVAAQTAARPSEAVPPPSPPVQAAAATEPAAVAVAAPPVPSQPVKKTKAAALPEFTRPTAPVRKIYIGSLGEGEGPEMLREKIAHSLQENHFLVVERAEEADAVLSGSGKWSSVRVKSFRARLVANGERVLWSGEVSSGGWIRSASSSVANKLVDSLVRAVAWGEPE